MTLPKLNTTDYNYTVTKAPTCTAEGMGRYTWKTTTYGTFYFDVTIAKTPHNYNAVVTPPTCTTQGYTTHTCTVCGDSYKDNYTAALGHDYSYSVTTAPTTAAAGLLTGTCSRCTSKPTVTLPTLNNTDYNYTVTKAATCTATGTGRYTWKTTTYGTFYFDVTIAKTPHNYNAVVTSPTCTTQGYTTHTCTVCGDSYKDSYTPVVPHSYTYAVTTQPTTAAAGILTGTCSRCSGTTTVTLPKLNTTDYNYTVTKAATCTATGTGRYTWKTTTYGTFYFDVTIAKTPHNYNAVVTAPTCTTQGYTTHTCTVCGDSYKDSYTPALDHAFSYAITANPTEAAVGVLTGTCSRCGEKTTVTLPKLNTTDYNYSVTKAATCTAEGTARYTWKNTNYGTFWFDVTLSKIPHDYQSVVTSPNCTEGGYTTHTCSVCGDSYVDGETDPLGHNFVNGVCSRCGYSDNAKLIVSAVSQTAAPGSTVSIPVMISGGEDFAGFTMKITADEGLTLKAIDKGALLKQGDGMFTKNVAQGTVNWTSSENLPGEGELFILSFEISEDAQDGERTVKLGLKDNKPSNMVDADENPVSTRFEDITVTVSSVLYGDTNSNGEVDTADSVRLVRYLVDLVELTELQKKAADVNHDNDITSADTIRLVRYLVGLVDSLDRVSPAQPARVRAHRQGDNAPVIQIGDVNGKPGESVTVPVTITGNPGFAGFTLEVQHAEELTLTKVTKGALLQESEGGSLLANPAKNLINWTDMENLTGDGELFTLSFVIAENAAAGNYQVTLVQKDGKPGNFINEDETPISVTFTPGSVTVISNPFGDVTANDYFYEPVLWAVGHQPRVASGTSSNTFSPNLACTRAQVVTFLWRAHGMPEPSSTESGFADVPAGCYYDKAVRWAVENNITAGTSATSFSPNQPCTRAQAVTFLWRAAGKPAAEGSQSFTDVKPDAFYTQAVCWAVNQGITFGTTQTTFSPNTICSRAQVVTFLCRCIAQSEGN